MPMQCLCSQDQGEISVGCWLMTKTIGNRKRDCVRGCSRWYTYALCEKSSCKEQQQQQQQQPPQQQQQRQQQQQHWNLHFSLFPGLMRDSNSATPVDTYIPLQLRKRYRFTYGKKKKTDILFYFPVLVYMCLVTDRILVFFSHDWKCKTVSFVFLVHGEPITNGVWEKDTVWWAVWSDHLSLEMSKTSKIINHEYARLSLMHQPNFYFKICGFAWSVVLAWSIIREGSSSTINVFTMMWKAIQDVKEKMSEIQHSRGARSCHTRWLNLHKRCALPCCITLWIQRKDISCAHVVNIASFLLVRQKFVPVLPRANWPKYNKHH